MGLHFAVINTDPVGAETSAPAAWLAAWLGPRPACFGRACGIGIFSR